MAGAPGTLVTGDAVVLDVQIAQLPVRAVAALIDLLVVGVGYVAGLLLWAMTLRGSDEALTSAILIIFTVGVVVGYPILFETATRGRSPGKFVMGLRVVSDDGGPERLRQVIFRSLAGFIEIWTLFGAPAVIASMLSPRGKRIGDIFAGTLVVSERGPRQPPLPPMPPGLAWWAATVELSGLAPGQLDTARQFLARADQLVPAVRSQMGYRIAAAVAARISPPPPPGTAPEPMLAAVLAERHRRGLVSLAPRGRQPSAPRPPDRSSPPPSTGGLVPPA